ncbi:unnamed protein product [Toxocara canis]|uniref:DUF5641 domain-containing protein n=1 Tax=Toxocara canis TaxID=6265 RepID=A0A183UPN3_TOXCA|nr:unnamed protein product [Toxocara canis]
MEWYQTAHQQSLSAKRTFPEVNEIVLLNDSPCSRGFWPLGIVEALNLEPSKIKKATIRLSNEPVVSAVTAQACEEIRSTKGFGSLQLEKTGYVLTVDNMPIDPCLANVTVCNASNGKCTAEGRIILWGGKLLVEQCTWHRVDTYLT